jgi:hypothetical protein
MGSDGCATSWQEAEYLVAECDTRITLTIDVIIVLSRVATPGTSTVRPRTPQGKPPASHKTLGGQARCQQVLWGAGGARCRSGYLTGADTLAMERLLHSRPLMYVGSMGHRALASVGRKHDYFLRRHYHHHPQSPI